MENSDDFFELTIAAESAAITGGCLWQTPSDQGGEGYLRSKAAAWQSCEAGDFSPITRNANSA